MNVKWIKIEEGCLMPASPQQVLIAWERRGMRLAWFTGIEGRRWAEGPTGLGHSYVEPQWWAPIDHPDE